MQTCCMQVNSHPYLNQAAGEGLHSLAARGKQHQRCTTAPCRVLAGLSEGCAAVPKSAAGRPMQGRLNMPALTGLRAE